MGARQVEPDGADRRHEEDASLIAPAILEPLYRSAALRLRLVPVQQLEVHVEVVEQLSQSISDKWSYVL